MISGFKVFFTVGERSLYYEKKIKTVMIKYSTNIKKNEHSMKQAQHCGGVKPVNGITTCPS